jgi:beta-glucosidase
MDDNTATSIGTQALAVTGTGRYVRMYGTVRGTQYGYSLWEFQVYSG